MRPPASLLPEPLALGGDAFPRLVLAPPRLVPHALVLGEAARILAHALRAGRELDDSIHGAAQERPVVRHEDDGGRRLAEEALQHVVPVEVEVVRRLVEEQHLEARQQDRGERGPRGLAPRERARRLLESLCGKPESGADGPRARRQIRAAQREEPIQRGGVPLGQLRLAPEARRERVHGLLGFEDAAAAGEVAEQRLAVLDVGLLRQVADRERPWSAVDAAEVRLLEPGEDPQQRRLPDPVRPDETDPGARPHDERDVCENDVGSVRFRDVARDERAGRALQTGPPDVGTLEPGSCLQHFVASTDRARRGSWCDPSRPAWEGAARRAEL